MRFNKKSVTRERTVTIGGITETVRVPDEEYEPIVPRDWDKIVTNIAGAIVGGLTLVSVVWSTWSIGDLLGGGVGYAAAVLFDLGWAMCLILEWLSRYDPKKRKAPKSVGWVLLLVAMAAIFWHGMLMGNVALAVVGAVVSLVAKVLWLMVMQHVNKELTPEHQAWMLEVRSKANAKLAVAEVLRAAARADDDALALRLQLEMSRRLLPADVVVEQLPDSVRNEEVGQRPDTVRTTTDTAGQLPDTVRPVPMPSVLTGPDGYRTLPDEAVSLLDEADNPSAFVRRAVHYGMDEIGDIVAWNVYLDKGFNNETLSRTLRRELKQS